MIFNDQNTEGSLECGEGGGGISELGGSRARGKL